MEKEINEQDQVLQRAIAHLMEDEAGVLLFRHMVTYCGIFKPAIVRGPDGIKEPDTIYNNGVQDVYLYYRKFIPKNKLSVIEQ